MLDKSKAEENAVLDAFGSTVTVLLCDFHRLQVKHGLPLICIFKEGFVCTDMLPLSVLKCAYVLYCRHGGGTSVLM